MKRSALRRRGVVLLFAIAVLALLSIIAVVFATNSRLERNVSRNYVDDARAKMCATAGLEMAISALRELAMSQAWDSPNAAWKFPLDPAQNPFRPRWGFPVELAKKPSFLGGPPLPNGGSVSGTNKEQLTSTYDSGRDYYRLKIIDCASKINVNMFDIGGSPDAKTILEGMLTTLGQAIQDTLPGAMNPIGSQASAITNYRLTLPGQVYANQSQLMEALRGPFPGDYEPRFYLLRDFVTTEGWEDESQHVAGNYRPAVDFPIQPNRKLDVMPRRRCPVNLNCAPEAVLVAVLTGLCGTELTMAPDGGAIMGVQPMAWTKTFSVSGGNSSYISYSKARQVAQAIITKRNTAQGAFNTWAQFEAFVDTLPLTPQQRMVVKANANPNMRFNKFIPNDVVFQRIDKVDVGYIPPGASSASPKKAGTTEFSFASMGYFEIESLGRVSTFTGSTEEVQASKVLFTVVRVYDAIRHTTQKDFEDNLVACSHARSYPESIDETGSGGEKGNQSKAGANPNDGCIAIGTEWDGAPHPGQTFFHDLSKTLSSTSPPMTPVVNKKHAAAGYPLSVQEGNDLVPDGVLNWRHPPGQEELAFTTNPQVIPDGNRALQGSIDVWVKLASDPAQGSDEVLLYSVKEMYDGLSVNQQGGRVSTPGQKWGIAWKLERFGNRIRSTRFLYGYPNREMARPAMFAPGVLAPGAFGANGQITGVPTLSLTEVDFFCTNWKAREWHRLTHVWTRGTEQSLTVDGQTYYGMTFQLPRETRRDVGAQRDFRPGMVFQVTVNGFRLITLTPEQRVEIGGYTYVYTNPQAAAQRMTVYNQQWQVQQGQTLARYPNALLDDVRFSTSTVVLGPRDRYSIAGGSFWRGKIPATKLGAGRLGTVSYTVYYPKAYAARALAPSDLRVTFKAGFQSRGMQAAPAPGSGAVTDGEGWGVYPIADRGMPPNEDLLWEIDFQNPGGLTPLAVTPVLDDVTVTVMVAPRMLEYSWMTRPEPQ